MEDRKSSILRAVVEEYINTEQPVGSSRVANAAGLSVSAATIRNDMAALERDGYLHQPHTSAGRVPTEAGYRLFVNELLESPGTLDRSQVTQVRNFFSHSTRELEGLLRETSGLLADLTNMAAVVVAPDQEVAEVRSVQIVSLHPGIALLVVVHSNGSLEKAEISVPVDLDQEVLPRSAAVLEKHLKSNTLPSDSKTGRIQVDLVVEAATLALSNLHGSDSDAVFVGGAARMVSQFEAVETVGRVLGILEQQLIIVSLLEDVLDRGMSVAIGTETGLPTLAECSLVVSPYEVEGEIVGTVGVLGPTRMDYGEALAAVALVSRRLGRSLSELTN